MIVQGTDTITTEAILDQPDREEGRVEKGPDSDRRELVARWVITARLTTLSAAQIGVQESDYCDQTYERDEDGCPLLYGTTLAGALRSSLSDRLAGYRSPDEAAMSRLTFGTTEQEDAHESRVIVFDSRAAAPAEAALRDGVHLDAHTRLAADRHKYDREVALPGVEFPVRFDLLISTQGEESVLLGALVLALEDLACAPEETPIALGAHRTRGMGLCRADRFRAERYDLTAPTGWLAYADSGYGADALVGLPPEREQETPQDAVKAIWSGALDRPADDRRMRLLLDFDLALESTLLIRSPGVGPEAPDDVHLTEAGKDLLSGTAFIGSLRHQTRRVLHTLPLTEEDRQGLLDDLFGPDPNSTDDPKASRVSLAGEPELREARRYQQTRTAIDRLSSATVEGALFEEEPCVGGWMKFRISVRQPLGCNTDCDAPLLLLAARDLLESLSVLGGEASIGRGIVSGRVTATLKQPQNFDQASSMTTADVPLGIESAKPDQSDADQTISMTTAEGVAEEDTGRFDDLFRPLAQRFLPQEAMMPTAETSQ